MPLEQFLKPNKLYFFDLKKNKNRYRIFRFFNYFQRFPKISKDFERLWASFVVMDEIQKQGFSNKFFESLYVNTLKIGGKINPKILILKPVARLS